jgi:hypothetical protein
MVGVRLWNARVDETVHDRRIVSASRRGESSSTLTPVHAGGVDQDQTREAVWVLARREQSDGPDHRLAAQHTRLDTESVHHTDDVVDQRVDGDLPEFDGRCSQPR